MRYLYIAMLMISLQACTNDVGALNSSASSIYKEVKLYHVNIKSNNINSVILGLVGGLHHDYGNSIDGNVIISYRSGYDRKYAEKLKNHLKSEFELRDYNVALKRDDYLVNDIDINVTSWKASYRRCEPYSLKVVNIKAGCFVDENLVHSIVNLENTGVKE